MQTNPIKISQGVAAGILCIAVWIVASSVTASVNDADEDRIPDTLDVDDDNDGIPDGFEIATNGADRDSDRDGIPDRLDLDSDNDGILDLEESGLFLVSGISAVRIVGGRLRTDVGANGFANLLETGTDNGFLAYRLLNSDSADGDALPDFLDLDSDNDGLLDLIEAGVPATLDSDRNGRIDAQPGQVGADGILDSVQLNNDANCCDYTQDGVEDVTPRNTDGGDLPDFQDVDSDNDGVFDLVEAGGRDLDADGRIDGFLDGSEEPDGVDDAIMLVPLTPPDLNLNGVPDYIDPLVQNTNVTVTPIPVVAPNPGDLQPGPVMPLPSDTVTPGVGPDLPADDSVPGTNGGPVATGLSGSGGCTVGKTTGFSDPLLPGLLIFAITYLYRLRLYRLRMARPDFVTGHHRN